MSAASRPRAQGKNNLSRINSETAREREVFKYYQPLVTRPDSEDAQPHSSWDTPLTAFAQLGALRLNVKRCMVSLVTRETKYIIAESTRTLSLQADHVHDQNDEMSIGVKSMPKADGVISHAVDVFAGNTECVPECAQRDEDSELSHIVVADICKDSCQVRRGLFKQVQNMHFFASVPLISKAGFAIGAYSVFDDEPRDGLSAKELSFLKDMARTTMEHLHTRRGKTQHYRSEKMIKGMGLFVEGGSSLREWWLRTGHESSPPKSDRGGNQRSLEERADLEFGVQDVAEDFRPENIEAIGLKGQSIASRRPLNSETDSHSGSVLTSMESDTESSVGYPVSEKVDQSTFAFSTTASRDTSALSPPKSPPERLPPDTEPNTAHTSPAAKPSSGGNAQPSSTATSPSGSRLQEALVSTSLKYTFARASNLLRESMSVSGALFLDASVGSFGGKADQGHDTAPSAFMHGSTPDPTSGSDEELKAKDERASPHNTKTCGILGYSTPTRSSLQMHKADELHSTVPESFLRRLLKRYPHGKIFNLDEDGVVSSSGDEETAKVLASTAVVKEKDEDSPAPKPRRKLTKEAEFSTILQIISGSRSIAFFPLWATHKERWFAGGFLWTTDPTRVLVPEEDLTFFAAFGNSIMAEVARLDALEAAQMKVNFMSSISHELRSPLHGVLASTELLQDSSLDTAQADMVNTIESCGRTLLDTIDHVLDFSRVDTRHKQQVRKSRKPLKPSFRQVKGQKTRGRKVTWDSESAAKAPDLGVLTEEVVNSVYAGRHHRNPSATTFQRRPDSDAYGYRKPGKLPVMVIMDISYRENFKFPVEPGAWRRIIMNVFGNALKYTASGFIKVCLDTKDEIAKDGSSRYLVTLTVSDSGKGISPEFLRNHLFTPFAQEDSLAVGTGLGLSIVRQIVDDMGGTIDYQSETGSGTKAVIQLPMPALSLPWSAEEPFGKQIETARKKTRGLRACLISFDVTPDMDDTSGILSTEAERMLSLKSALTPLLKDWFQMEVSFSNFLSTSKADVNLVMESDFVALKTNDYFEIDQALKASQGEPSPAKLPILLVLSSLDSNMTDEIIGGFNIIKLQQPYGPSRMANVFSRCLEQRDRPSSSSSPSKRPTIPDRRSSATDTTSAFPAASPSKSLAVRTRIPLQNSIDSPSMQSDDQPDTSLPTVLLVEDNEINLKLLVTYMRKLHVPFSAAVNGLEALEAYKSATQPYDVILMDISMPIMDGLTSSREIRSFEKNNDRVPSTIIALTGAASPEARQEAFASGIDRYLTKPVPMQVLKNMLSEFKTQRLHQRKVERKRDRGESSAERVAGVEKEKPQA